MFSLPGSDAGEINRLAVRRGLPARTVARREASLSALMPRPRAPLTARESEVLRLVAEGYSTREIAGDLYVSHKTMQSHLRSVIRKMGGNGGGAGVREPRRTPPSNGSGSSSAMSPAASGAAGTNSPKRLAVALPQHPPTSTALSTRSSSQSIRSSPKGATSRRSHGRPRRPARPVTGGLARERAGALVAARRRISATSMRRMCCGLISI
jgi:DNA-binding CsgD family transcriptional regulator